MPTTTKNARTRREGGRSRSERSGGSSERGRGSAERGRGSSERGGSSPRITAKNLSSDDRKFIDRHGSRLSPSTLRAKWIHSTDEREDRPGQTLATRSPEVIRAWAEAREAVPATVGRKGDERPRTLRFDFPANGPSRRLEPIDWDSWLGTFEERNLVFIYQEQRRDGRESNFFRLDSPEREEG